MIKRTFEGVRSSELNVMIDSVKFVGFSEMIITRNDAKSLEEKEKVEERNKDNPFSFFSAPSVGGFSDIYDATIYLSEDEDRAIPYNKREIPTDQEKKHGEKKND